MRLNDQPARPKGLAASHSLRRTLVVAVLVTAVPAGLVLALSVPGLALAFLGGVVSGGLLAALRRRTIPDAGLRSTIGRRLPRSR